MKHIYAEIHNLVFGIVVIAAAVILLALGACTTAPTGQNPGDPQTVLQGQLAAFCAVAPAEMNAIVAGKAAFSTTTQQTLPQVQAFIDMNCAPGVVATATDVQTLVQTILPAFTTIALEYAAQKKAAGN